MPDSGTGDRCHDCFHTGPAADPAVLYVIDDAVGILTLSRPQALNSFTRQMHRDLWAAMGRGHDYMEGVTAILEKRPAVLKGE